MSANRHLVKRSLTMSTCDMWHASTTGYCTNVVAAHCFRNLDGITPEVFHRLSLFLLSLNISPFCTWILMPSNFACSWQPFAVCWQLTPSSWLLHIVWLSPVAATGKHHTSDCALACSWFYTACFWLSALCCPLLAVHCSLLVAFGTLHAAHTARHTLHVARWMLHVAPNVSPRDVPDVFARGETVKIILTTK